MIYPYFLRPLLFLLEAERAHGLGIRTLAGLGELSALRNGFESCFSVQDPRLKRELFGLEFPNPLGIGAGLDKSATAYKGLGAFGPGFVEVGTVTPRPQTGNPKPRLFRIPEERALLNRMGFNNDGAEAVAERLQKRKRAWPLIGANLGKNKDTPNEAATEDHDRCFRILHPYVDYWVINISSPNTPGLRELQGKDALRELLEKTLESKEKFSKGKPLLLKLSPDLDRQAMDDMLEVLVEKAVDGLIATNTSNRREELLDPRTRPDRYGHGGISGEPLKDPSNATIRYLKEATGGSLPIIGVGGIMNEDDALDKLDAGADLIQVYTGLIYRGPALMKRILRAILARQEAT